MKIKLEEIVLAVLVIVVTSALFVRLTLVKGMLMQSMVFLGAVLFLVSVCAIVILLMNRPDAQTRLIAELQTRAQTQWQTTTGTYRGITKEEAACWDDKEGVVGSWYNQLVAAPEIVSTVSGFYAPIGEANPRIVYTGAALEEAKAYIAELMASKREAEPTLVDQAGFAQPVDRLSFLDDQSTMQ